MGIMRKALDNGKKLARASANLMPKGRTGNVVKEPEDEEEEMEVEEQEIEEPVEEEVEETFEEIKEAPEVPEKEINYVVGEIRTYAKEIGYAVTDTDGKPIECESYAQAILVSQAVKNETTTE